MAVPALSDDSLSAPSAASLDRAIDALLGGLRWQSSVFHVGQYCGRWRASTAGRAQASFHLVLRGHCWLHRPGQPSVPLAPGDGVFLLRDLPHFLSPYEDAALACAPQAMQPLADEDIGATGLACGFFAFDGPMQQLVAASFPEVLVLAADDPAMAGGGALFGLMRQEAAHASVEGSPVMDRLAGLLFFYAMRAVAHRDAALGGVLGMLRRPGFARLVLELMQSPARPWTVSDMAQRVNLSRAALFRQFGQLCGQSPLQFLLQLRMQLAAQRLSRGEGIACVAEAVGYDSQAAFARAFKRVTGRQPGAWQRAHAAA